MGSGELPTPSMEVFSAEFDREFGSVQIINIIAPGSSEYDREWGSVGLPATGEAAIENAEFDWESGSTRLRQFGSPTNTPTSRIHYVRVCDR